MSILDDYGSIAKRLKQLENLPIIAGDKALDAEKPHVPSPLIPLAHPPARHSYNAIRMMHEYWFYFGPGSGVLASADASMLTVVADRIKHGKASGVYIDAYRDSAEAPSVSFARLSSVKYALAFHSVSMASIVATDCGVSGLMPCTEDRRAYIRVYD